MIRYKVLNVFIKLRWLLMLAGIGLMFSYLFGEQPMSIMVLFTGIVLNILSLIGITVNCIKLVNTPIEWID